MLFRVEDDVYRGVEAFAEECCIRARPLWNVALCPNMPTMLAAAVALCLMLELYAKVVG